MSKNKKENDKKYAGNKCLLSLKNLSTEMEILDGYCSDKMEKELMRYFGMEWKYTSKERA